MPELFPDLDLLPRHSYAFLWADYVEILCLCSQNGLVSKGNLQAQAQEAEDNQADINEGDLVDNEEAAGLQDRISAKWDDIAQRFNARQASFPGWPFELDGAVLRSRFDATRQDHRLYVALLIASTLRLCDETRSGEVTSAFEEISYLWLRRSLPSFWRIRPFGAHATLPDAYTGTLREKLEALATDITATLMKHADEYDPANTGDGGIDLVAWQEMGDKRGNHLVIFGQCACSPTDWESKQLDVTPSASEAHISPHHPGAAYCFVPHDLSLNETRWQRAAHIKRAVLIDRKRLLHLFQRIGQWNGMPAWGFVDDALLSHYRPAA